MAADAAPRGVDDRGVEIGVDPDLPPHRPLARGFGNCAGDRIAVAWQEGDKEIVARLSNDGGRTWLGKSAVRVAEVEKGNLRLPQVAVSDQGAWVLWERWADMTGVRKTLALGAVMVACGLALSSVGPISMSSPIRKKAVRVPTRAACLVLLVTSTIV